MTENTELVTKLTTREVQLAHDRQAIDAQIKKLMMERDAIDERLRAKLEDHGARLGVHRSQVIVELRPWERNGVDIQALRVQLPDVAAQFPKHSEGLTLHYDV